MKGGRSLRGAQGQGNGRDLEVVVWSTHSILSTVVSLKSFKEGGEVSRFVLGREGMNVGLCVLCVCVVCTLCHNCAGERWCGGEARKLWYTAVLLKEMRGH
jgi:hypothetical protein